MTSSSTLLLTSLQAPHADPFCRRLVGYLCERLGLAVRFADDQPWQARERRLDNREIDVAWICGHTYTRRKDVTAPTVRLLVAPVMAKPRYQDRPIYFSDVVVRRASPWRTFADLRGARWAYNEPNSHSGHCITRFQLARAGHGSGFFASAEEAGSHEAALRLLLQDEVDATALDSTVLDAKILLRPQLREELRVIAAWGPSPIPPWVVASHVGEPTRLRMKEILTSMHLDPLGREVLGGAQIARFNPVEDAEYDAIRHMAEVAEGITI